MYISLSKISKVVILLRNRYEVEDVDKIAILSQVHHTIFMLGGIKNSFVIEFSNNQHISEQLILEVINDLFKKLKIKASSIKYAEKFTSKCEQHIQLCYIQL